MLKSKSILFCLLMIVSSVLFAANPVVVDGGGSGDFLTIQAAISSWCGGGSNAGETAPFVIQIKPGSYEEKISLYDARPGLGDIVGDIKLQAFDTTSKPIIKVMVSDTTMNLSGTTATRQGIMVYQNTANVEFRDLVFTYSLISSNDFGTGIGAQGWINGNLIKIDESTPNVASNTVSFYNCVITTPDTSGAPLVTSKAQALAGDFWSARTSIALGGTPMLQHWGDTGECLNGVFENCTFYGSNSFGFTARTDGYGNPEKIVIKDCLLKDLGFYSSQIGGINPNGQIIVTGSKPASEGDLFNSHVVLNSGRNSGGGHLLYFTGATANIDISNVIAYTEQTIARAISGSTQNIKIRNSLLVYNSIGIVHNPSSERTFTAESCTFLNYNVLWGRGYPSGGSLYYGLVAVSPATSTQISFKDCIVAGAAGYKIGGGVAFASLSTALALNNVAFVTTGTYAMVNIGNLTNGGNVVMGVDTTQTDISSCIVEDPMFASLDPTVSDFLDVMNTFYIGKASNGGILVGGANFKSTLSLNAPASVTLGQGAVLSVSGGAPPYTWTNSDTTVAVLSDTTGSSVTLTGIAIGQVTITVNDSAAGSEQAIIDVVPTSAPLVENMTMLPIDRKDIIRFDLFE